MPRFFRFTGGLWCWFLLMLLGWNSLSAQSPTLLHRLNAQLTEAIITDGFSPPVASRIYAYTHLAAYECVVPYHPELRSMAGVANGFVGLSRFDTARVNQDLLLLSMFTLVGKELVYRGHIMDDFKQTWLREMGQANSVAALRADSVAAVLKTQFIQWVRADGFLKVKEGVRYQPFRGPQFWEPTPPAYMDALESNWGQLRTLIVKDANAVKVELPLAFDTVVGSPFRVQAEQVMQAVNALSPEQREVAKFWDCNPLQTQVMGHMTFVSRQLTPVGHWMGITSIACQQNRLGLGPSAQAYMLCSAAIFDAFIVTWKEKYRSALIRPETYINKYIDPNWRPILETPPFPEHPSGHSVISAAAAEVLTALLGDAFQYTDSTEQVFGLGVRSFSSFRQAANEAGSSRLLGGIHYPRAIEVGQVAGREIGKMVLDRAH